MTRRQALLAVLAAALVCLSGGGALAGIVPGYEYVPGEVIIKFKPGVTGAQKADLLAELQGAKVREFRGIQAEHRTLSGMTVEEAVARFDNDPRIEYIQPNYMLYMVTTPNDPDYGYLWGMNNTGTNFPPGGRAGTADADIDAPEAWTVFTGSSDVVVCVIDTGVNYTHPDLAGNIWTNPGEIAGNGIDDDGNGFIDDIHGWDFYNDDNDPMDDNGHGSHCAGTIGAVGDNGIGVAGVAWDVTIMGCKFLSSGGSGSTADAIGCIEYATAMGVDIMSNSWGGGPYDTAMETAIQNAYNAGIFFVAAAGNSGVNTDTSPHYPSSYTNGNVISVMATDPDDQRVVEAGWWSSNYGATSVDIAAPGLFIWSTVLGTGYDNYSGTSMATPHVSGALAMLRGRFPNITVDAGKNLLMTVGNDVLPSLAGLCVSEARLNLLKLIADPDTIPPSGVTDLATTEVASNWIELEWTAPADDFDTMTGTCSSYDLRYATSPIDDTTWAAATPITGEPNPEAPGTLQGMRVNGLDFSTTYYFAIKALDEYGSQGPLSNVPYATTLGAPTVSVAPTSLSASLETGGTDTQTLTISNTGEGVLDFTIPGAEYIIPTKARFAPVKQHDYVELGKGAADPRPAIPAVTGAGGPDAFGYTWRDSDEPGGPAFNWIEIDTVGTPIGFSSDDANLGPFPIGFTFPFYGNDFTEFRACTNGWISFTSTATSYSNSALPAAGAPANMLAMFWDDLTFTSAGEAYYYYDGTRLIIEYAGVPHLSSGGPYSMQVHLYPNGLIEYHYLLMPPPVNSSTIGIQNADGTDGLTVAFNADYVHDNMAIRFASVPPWLSVAPNSGSVAAGASVDVAVTFDATGLCGSHFDANLHVMSNDPVTPDYVVPVGLDLTGTPDIQLSAASLDFGSVYITADATLDLIVINNGCADLTVSGLVIDNGDFTTAQAVPFTLLAGQTQAVPIVFAPSLAGPIAGTLTVTSDDPDSPTLYVALAGVGLDFPDIAVAPASLTETLPTGGTSTQMLTITNSGLGDLNFTIPEAEYISTAKKAAAPAPGAEPIELGKDDIDPRVGSPVVLGAGGPDVFGYRWKDSDEPGGPAFNWIEIQGVGTQVTLTDDSNVPNNPIGFSFPFYGNTFTTFNIASNGWVSFTNTTSGLTNYLLPSTSAPENLLAVFHDDLNPSLGGWIGYHNDGQRLIVEYKDVPRYSSGGPYSMQIHLYPSGRIEYHYLSMLGTRLNEATIGIQNATKDDGLTVVYNAAYVHDNLAIRFQALPSWLSAAPNSGTVPPGTSVDVTVGFNAAELCGDQYLANLHVLSNDPDSPDVAVPVTLNLIGEPDVEVAPTALDFGEVYLTQIATLPVTLANAGCATLDVTGLTIDNPVFTVDATAPFSVPVGAGVPLNVTFTPVAAGPETGVMTITTNDPVTPVVTVDLTGTGLSLAQVVVTPSSLYQIVPVNGIRTANIHIENTGAGDLTFTVPSPDLYNKTVAAAKAAAPAAAAERDKDAADTEFGVTPLGSGGPDAYGYRWVDSDDPGGPTFDFIDISETGAVALSTGDDANGGPFPIGFTFKYYGNQFDTFRVCSNGWLSFSSTATSYSNVALPSASAPLNLLAPFWDDLNLGIAGSGDVYYQNVGGNLVVMWDNVFHYGTTTGAYTFEAIITPSGQIYFQYLTLAGAVNSVTVGIQDATGTTGLGVVYNAAYLHNNLAIRFSAMPQWMTCDPVAGTIPAGGSADVTVTFDSAGMDIGEHTGMVRILSNDLGNPEVQVPVTMNVQDLTSVDDDELPTVVALGQNVPNPFNPMTTISFSLPAKEMVDLRVYDVRGALVRTLVHAEMEAGNRTVVWDGRGDDGRQVPSGVYFYRMKAGASEFTRRMTMVK